MMCCVCCIVWYSMVDSVLYGEFNVVLRGSV